MVPNRLVPGGEIQAPPVAPVAAPVADEIPVAPATAPVAAEPLSAPIETVTEDAPGFIAVAGVDAGGEDTAGPVPFTEAELTEGPGLTPRQLLDRVRTVLGSWTRGARRSDDCQ